MSMTESLQANLPSFLRSASVADIALVLEATSIELRKRALPGSVQLDTSAHVLRLYVSAFTSARVAIHGDDCTLGPRHGVAGHACGSPGCPGGGGPLAVVQCVSHWPVACECFRNL